MAKQSAASKLNKVVLKSLFFNNYVSLRYIQLRLGNTVAPFLGKSCKPCLPSGYFMAA